MYRAVVNLGRGGRGREGRGEEIVCITSICVDYIMYVCTYQY
jgi:hypothetical protein